MDNVNHPKHYLVGGIEAIDIIQSRLTKEEFIGYLKGSKLKYDLRYPFKNNPEEDLEKSEWYVFTVVSFCFYDLFSNHMLT
ncbi:DUF3310 domain-containing protein [bacterium]|nr:DUF3310 domain-containing protein [bacterium]